jgi:hypothetical protein
MATAPRKGGGARSGGGERPPGGLVGGGPSQLGVDGSMRARDVSRPSETDVDTAERNVRVSYRPRSGPRQDPGTGGTGGSSPVSS